MRTLTYIRDIYSLTYYISKRASCYIYYKSNYLSLSTISLSTISLTTISLLYKSVYYKSIYINLSTISLSISNYYKSVYILTYIYIRQSLYNSRRLQAYSNTKFTVTYALNP
ncbi:hypothetical protein K504DRAFT_452227 [Pleomassaria siparia CBS 279.74]|uniref:Uncharacterized protein n=1 Tax=Pleomassaria siparia CBS 279.74 TaxID=1314801 RepID=A0A6G1KHX9_9PLEO|nr:hypothetical protein K504DRAFT_452227 [Pleomassaria siparia CBS 279.74]